MIKWIYKLHRRHLSQQMKYPLWQKKKQFILSFFIYNAISCNFAPYNVFILSKEPDFPWILYWFQSFILFIFWYSLQSSITINTRQNFQSCIHFCCKYSTKQDTVNWQKSTLLHLLFNCNVRRATFIMKVLFILVRKQVVQNTIVANVCAVRSLR